MARKEITVSEVHRYQVVTMLSAAGATIGYDPHGPDVVMAADFDRVTAERDALQALLTAADERADVQQQRLTELQRQLGERWSEISAYQDTVEKQSERADVLEGLLREAMPALDLAASAFKSAMPVRSKVRAALKPAEPAKEGHVCTGCGNKGWTANCKECVPY